MRHRLTFTITAAIVTVVMSFGFASAAAAAVTDRVPPASELRPDSELPRHPDRSTSEITAVVYGDDQVATELWTISCEQAATRPGWSTPIASEPGVLGGSTNLSVDIPVPDPARLTAGWELVAVEADGAIVHRSGCSEPGERVWPWQGELYPTGSAARLDGRGVTTLPAGVRGALLPGAEAPEAVPTTTTTSVVEAPADDAFSDDGADDTAVDPSTSEEDPEAYLDDPEFSPELREGAGGGDSGRSSPITGTWWAGVAVAGVATAISRARDRERVAGDRRPAGRHPVIAGIGGLIAVAAGIVAVTGLRGAVAGALLAAPPGLVVGWALAGRVASTHLFADELGRLLATGWREGRNSVLAWAAGGVAAAWLVASGSSRLPAMVFAGLVFAIPAAAAQGARAENAHAGRVAQLREMVAAVLGTSAVQLEQMGSVHVDADQRIRVAPLPATAMRAATAPDLADRVASVMPGWSVAEASSTRVVLVPVALDLPELDRRRAVEASGGLVVGVDAPTSPSIASDDVVALVFDPDEEHL
jgi:hypothetical protein